MSRATDDFDFLGKIHDKMLKTEVIGKALKTNLNIQFFVTVMYIKLRHY